MKTALLFLSLLFVASVRICPASEPNAIRDKVAHNTTIQGFPCARGVVWFYPDGALDECTLSAPAAIGDLRVPRHSVVELWPDGGARFVMLPHTAVLGSYRVRGGTLHGLSRGAATAFYRTGELQSFYLPANQTIQGVPCGGGAWNTYTDPSGGETRVELYPNGKIESCKLSRDFSGFRSDQRIVFPHLTLSATTVAADNIRAAQ